MAQTKGPSVTHKAKAKRYKLREWGSLSFSFSSSLKKEGGSSPLSLKDLDTVSTSKTQLVLPVKEVDVKDSASRERETSNIEPQVSSSPKEEPRPPR